MPRDTAKTIKDKYGSDYYYKLGKLGGRANAEKNPGLTGFKTGDPKTKAAGSKGGKNSRPSPRYFMLHRGNRIAVVDFARKKGINYHSLMYRLKRDGLLID